ncbi:ATP-binding protein [Akkermansia muciniphila]|uniref:ATP-binding protein n=1 Tax=Akkermansia muciniphila TaxID=239935 RepID=UPI003F8F5DB4
MKLKNIYLKNFRCYQNEISIEFDDLTTFVGKNDIGKSTILEALEIFFNNDLVKIESSDANIHGDKNVVIACDFCDLPSELILDSGEITNLDEEYLTLSDDTLQIKKVYDCSKSKVTPTTYIVANHPCVQEFENLISLKEKDLQKIIRSKGINAPLKGNPSMRKAIWHSTPELNIQKTEIEVSKIKEEGREIWSKISSYLPSYALFQSDRSSQDSDGEVQNPMKMAIQEAISEVQEEINAIQKKVQDKAMTIAQQTQNALKSIDRNLANQLTPKFTPPLPAKWNNLFSIAMDTDEGIALNKRGSGVRRMILVGFFKAEAERKLCNSKKKNIIYAIEEPETAQHPNNQKILVNSFKEISKSEKCQVILTTHSPGLAQELPIDSLRFIDRNEEGYPIVKSGEDVLSSIVETLGMLPDTNQNIKLILCLEGPTDIIAFKAFSRCLRTKYSEIINLETDNRILVVPLGGSTLKHWVEKQYFKKLGCPEIHIYDNDVNKYQKHIKEVNKRGDASWGTLTRKYEIENYLHTDAIKAIYHIDVNTDQQNVPNKFASAYYEANKDKLDKAWNDNTAKKRLSKVFTDAMTCDLLEERDPDGEVKGWFEKMASILSATFISI